MMIRLGAALAICAIAAGCAGPERKAAAPAPDTTHLQRVNCYTVDLFDEPEFKAPETLSAEKRRYIGHWRGGTWNGKWCHDLIVTGIETNGRVHVLDMHGPSTAFNEPATIFRRTGRIHEDGSLRFAHGTVTRRYILREGKLHGHREGDGHGALEAVLSRAGAVPMPRPRPVRIARR